MHSMLLSHTAISLSHAPLQAMQLLIAPTRSNVFPQHKEPLKLQQKVKKPPTDFHILVPKLSTRLHQFPWSSEPVQGIPSRQHPDKTARKTLLVIQVSDGFSPVAPF